MSDYYAPVEKVMPLFGAARLGDPPTSHAAGRSAPVRSQRDRVLAVLRLGPGGQSELAARCGLLPHQVNKRLSDLCKDGEAELTGREVQGLSGCWEREWRVKG